VSVCLYVLVSVSVCVPVCHLLLPTAAKAGYLGHTQCTQLHLCVSLSKEAIQARGLVEVIASVFV
jgi:hypothetical protein